MTSSMDHSGKNGITMLRYIVIITCLAALPAVAAAQGDVDAQGTLQGMNLGNAGPSVPHGTIRNEYEYYNTGTVMSCSKLTATGRLFEKDYYYPDGKLRSTERFNEAGDKIEEANFSELGALTEGAGGWAAKRWVYKDGAMRIESTYGTDGKLTQRLLYNASGDLVDRQFVGDGDIDPNEEFNRGVVVTHETDQFFNSEGQETGSVTTHVDDPDDMFGDPFWD